MNPRIIKSTLPLYTQANRGPERGCEHTVKKLHSWEQTPSVACFGSCALRVAMAGIRELPASPHPPSLFPPEAWASAVPAVPGFELPTRGADADMSSRGAQHCGPPLRLSSEAYSLMQAFSSICLRLGALPSPRLPHRAHHTAPGCTLPFWKRGRPRVLALGCQSSRARPGTGASQPKWDFCSFP